MQFFVLQTKLNNCHILINNEGTIEKVYRKLHLFDVSIPEKNIQLKESDYVNSGKELIKPVMTPAGAVALSIVITPHIDVSIIIYLLCKLRSSVTT